MKGIYVVGKKLAQNGRKMAKLKGCLFFKSPVFNTYIRGFWGFLEPPVFHIIEVLLSKHFVKETPVLMHCGL